MDSVDTGHLVGDCHLILCQTALCLLEFEADDQTMGAADYRFLLSQGFEGDQAAIGLQGRGPAHPLSPGKEPHDDWFSAPYPPLARTGL